MWQCTSNGVLATRLLDVESFRCFAHSLHLVLAPLFFPKRKPRTAIEICDDDIVNADAKEDFETILSCDEDVLIETVTEKVEVLQDLAKHFCKSTKGTEKLKFLQSAKPVVGCILDVVMKWDTHHRCKTSTDGMSRRLVCRIETPPYVSVPLRLDVKGN